MLLWEGMVICYIASKYENKPDVQKLRDQLIALGHTITEDWTVSKEENNNRAAVACWNGVIDCDVFIGLFDKPYAFKGAYVELGMAIAYHKIIVIIGHHADAQVFIHLSWFNKFATVEQFVGYLTQPAASSTLQNPRDRMSELQLQTKQQLPLTP